LLSVACSGFGLAFVAAVLVQVLLEPDRRSRLGVALLPAFAYLTWYLVVARGYGLHDASSRAVEASRLPAPGPWLLARYVAYGLGAAGVAAAGVIGDPTKIGWPVYAFLLLTAGVVIVGSWRRIDGRLLGAAAGLIVLNITTGFIRVQEFGVAQAGANRYMYPAVVLLLLLTTAVVARVRWRPLVGAVAAGLVAVAVIGNVAAFGGVITQLNGSSAAVNAQLRTINAARNSPDLDRQASFPWDGIVVGAFLADEYRYGSPVPMVSLAKLRSSPSTEVDVALRTILSPGLRLTPASGATACSRRHVTDFRLVSGGTRTISVTGAGMMAVQLGWTAAPATAQTFAVHTGLWTLRVPDVGSKGFPWHVILGAPPKTLVWAC